LRQSETNISAAKVNLKLHEIEFKLDVEKRVKDGTEKMHKLYMMDPSMGDKKSRHEVAQKLADTNEKMVLLKRALQKYHGLYVGEDDEEEDDATAVQDVPRAKAVRKPITGVLQIHVSMARQLAHAPHRGTFRGSNETYCVLKVDSVQKAKTRTSRQQKWNEDFELRVDKAGELDITIYDKSGDKDVPIGLLWIKIAEVTEELRRMAVAAGLAPSPSLKYPEKGEGSFQGPVTAAAPSVTENGIEAWWDVEPIGQVHLRLNFGMVLHFLLNCVSARWWPQETLQTRSPGCAAHAKGRGPRTERPQVCQQAILPNHEVRLLLRVFAGREWVPVRRLPLLLPQALLSQGGDQVHRACKLRRRPR
jgi:hypothetical protein